MHRAQHTLILMSRFIMQAYGGKSAGVKVQAYNSLLTLQSHVIFLLPLVMKFDNKISLVYRGNQ
jgi:hypothetical protein